LGQQVPQHDVDPVVVLSSIVTVTKG
jgi:hypothetical protein